MKMIIPLFVSFGLLLSACGVPQAEYDTLKEEIKQLRSQVEACQLNATGLLKEATLNYERLDYKKSKEQLVMLTEKYPNSKEVKQGKKLMVKLSKKLLATEEALKRDRLIEDSKTVLGSMNKKTNHSNGVTFYTDQSSSKAADVNIIYIYAGSKEKSKPWIGIAINRFSKEEWLHILKVMIHADGKIFNIEEEKPDDFKTHKEPNGYREWIDRALSKEKLEMIEKIANSKEATLTLIGKEVSEKRIISIAEKKAMKNILEVYKILGGV